MNEAKKQRIAEAEHARRLKRARETSALSIALLRATSARSVLLDEVAALQTEGGTFLDEHATAMNQLVVNRASRASAILTLYYASLNVVVEGWLRADQAHPPLADARIDALLASEFTKALADYRNAMLHPNPLLDPRFVQFTAAHPGLTEWAHGLCDEFLRFFRDWHRSVAQASAKPA